MRPLSSVFLLMAITGCSAHYADDLAHVEPVVVEIADRTYDVRIEGQRAYAYTHGGPWMIGPAAFRHNRDGAVEAIRQASGCNVDPASIYFDKYIMHADLACSE